MQHHTGYCDIMVANAIKPLPEPMLTYWVHRRVRKILMDDF